MINNPKVIAGKSGVSEIENAYSSKDLPSKLSEIQTIQNAASAKRVAELAKSPKSMSAPLQETQNIDSSGHRMTAEEDQAFNEYMNHLQAIRDTHEHLTTTQPSTQAEGPDLDSEPLGFDTSDKLGMLGAAAVGGMAGFMETGARAGQLLALGAEKLHLAKAGASDKFTDWVNRKESRSKLLSEAMQTHPIMTEIGRFGGGAAAVSAAIAAAAAALPEAAGVSAAAGTVAAASKLAKATKIAEGLQKVIPVGAAKSIINAKRVGQAIQMAKLFGKNAIIGETVYDPENSHYLSQGLLGGIMGVALHKSGDLIKRLATPLGTAIKDAATTYGIELPIYPSVEKVAKKVFGSGQEAKIQQRGEKIVDIGKNLVNEISEGAEGKNYDEYFTGELAKANKENIRKIGEINDRIDLATKGKGDVDISNVKATAAKIDTLMSSIPEALQNRKVANIAKTLTDVGAESPALSWQSFRETMKELGANVGKTRNANTKKHLGDLYNSFDKDLELHLKKVGGEALEDYNEQKLLHIQKRLPFINGKFQSFGKENSNSDNFIGKFFRPDEPTRASELLEMLPDKEKGIVAARAAILNQAMHDAHIEGVGVNPVKFINSVLNLGKTNDVVFEKSQMDSLLGYKRLLTLISGISKEALDPNFVKNGLPQTHIAMDKLLKAGVFGSGGYYAGTHFLNLSGPVLAMLAVTPTVFSRIITSKAGQAFLGKVHSMAVDYTDKELDHVTSTFLKHALKTAKYGAVQKSVEVGRNL